MSWLEPLGHMGHNKTVGQIKIHSNEGINNKASGARQAIARVLLMKFDLMSRSGRSFSALWGGQGAHSSPQLG